jgi:hypothetical protein
MLPETPAWLPAAQGLVSGIFKGVEALIASNKGGSSAPGQLQAGASGPSNGAPAVVNSDRPDAEIWAELGKANREAAEMTQAVWPHLQGTGFQTHEWRLLLFNINARYDTDKLAEKLVDHVIHLAEYGNLPRVIGDVLDAPRKRISPIITALPIHSVDAAYTARLIDAFCKELESRKEDDEEEPEVVGTPPAGAVPGSVVEMQPQEVS